MHLLHHLKVPVKTENYCSCVPSRHRFCKLSCSISQTRDLPQTLPLLTFTWNSVLIGLPFNFSFTTSKELYFSKVASNYSFKAVLWHWHQPISGTHWEKKKKSEIKNASNDLQQYELAAQCPNFWTNVCHAVHAMKISRKGRFQELDISGLHSSKYLQSSEFKQKYLHSLTNMAKETF